MRILVAEDNEQIALLIRQLLERNNFIVDHFATLGLVKEALQQQTYDLVILDRGLPDGDGLEILEDLGKAAHWSKRPPFLVLSAWGEVTDIVDGLEAGAVDYMTKPYNSDELLARIRSNIRKRRKLDDHNITFGNLVYEVNHMHVSIKGKTLQLGRRQLCILEMLLKNRDKIVAHERLETAAYGFDDQISSNSLTSQISRLRKALQEADANVKIKGMRNLGYVLKEDVS